MARKQPKNRGPVMGECEPDEIDDWHRDNEAGRKFKSGGGSGSGSGSGSDHGSGDGRVWWEFQGPGAWERYDDSVALLIETAFAAADGSPVTFSNQWGNYAIDWNRMEQVNLQTKKRRMIRRQASSSSSSSSSSSGRGDRPGGRGGAIHHQQQQQQQQQQRSSFRNRVVVGPVASPAEAFARTAASLVQWECLAEGVWRRYDGGKKTALQAAAAARRTSIDHLHLHGGGGGGGGGSGATMSLTEQLETAFAATPAGKRAAAEVLEGAATAAVAAAGGDASAPAAAKAVAAAATAAADASSSSSSKDVVVRYQSRNQQYGIDVGAFEQVNLGSGTKRPVRRVVNGRQTHPMTAEAEAAAAAAVRRAYASKSSSPSSATQSGSSSSVGASPRAGGAAASSSSSSSSEKKEDGGKKSKSSWMPSMKWSSKSKKKDSQQSEQQQRRRRQEEEEQEQQQQQQQQEASPAVLMAAAEEIASEASNLLDMAREKDSNSSAADPLGELASGIGHLLNLDLDGGGGGGGGGSGSGSEMAVVGVVGMYDAATEYHAAASELRRRANPNSQNSQNSQQQVSTEGDAAQEATRAAAFAEAQRRRRELADGLLQKLSSQGGGGGGGGGTTHRDEVTAVLHESEVNAGAAAAEAAEASVAHHATEEAALAAAAAAAPSPSSSAGSGGGGSGRRIGSDGSIAVLPSLFNGNHRMGDFGYEIQVSLLRDAERADALLGKSKGSFADFGFGGGGGGRKGGSARVSPYTVEGAPAPSGLTLYVFNDNNNDRNTSMRGGNNAAVRQYNRFSDCRPVRAAGVCTGLGSVAGGFGDLTRGGGGSSGSSGGADTNVIKAIIDRDLAEIRALLATGCYSTVVYSASGDAGDPEGLGTGIFQVAPATKQYIVQNLKSLATN